LHIVTAEYGLPSRSRSHPTRMREQAIQRHLTSPVGCEAVWSCPSSGSCGASGCIRLAYRNTALLPQLVQYLAGLGAAPRHGIHSKALSQLQHLSAATSASAPVSVSAESLPLTPFSTIAPLGASSDAIPSAAQPPPPSARIAVWLRLALRWSRPMRQSVDLTE